MNDPTESTWEAGAREEGGALLVELHPRGLADPRFAYRVRDVPAASHPPLAAAMVRVAGRRPDDVRLGPFHGLGRRARRARARGPYARLHGTDTDAGALDAARANFAAAGVEDVAIELGRRDASAPQGTTLIVTNPPMGRRVTRDGTLASLLERFVDHAAEVLPPEGASSGCRRSARGRRARASPGDSP